MFSTTTSKSLDSNLLSRASMHQSPWAGLSRIGDAILNWMVRVGEMSSAARSAERFSRLNALSDEELEARGLKREHLVQVCFGRFMTY